MGTKMVGTRGFRYEIIYACVQKGNIGFGFRKAQKCVIGASWEIAACTTQPC
jgi:hypothetical protein